MPEPLLLLLLLLIVPVVLLFATAGCVGDDVAYAAGKEEGTKIGAAEATGKIQEENRYDATIAKDTKLVSYWRLNEPEGDQVAHALGPQKKDGAYLHTAGITLQHSGTLALFEDKQDKAAYFKGTEGWVQVDHHLPLNTPEISIECWIQPMGTAPGPEVVLGSYEVNAAGDVVSGYVLEVVRPPAPTGVPPQPRLRVRLGGGGTAEADLGPGTQRQGWRHVVVTFQQSSPTSLKLFVDAATGDPAAEVDGGVYTVLGPPLPLRMGAGQSAPGVPGLFYNGGLDEVAIYTGVLTQNEIKNHYQKSF